MKIETVQQMLLRDVPRGEFVRRKLDAKTTYTRGANMIALINATAATMTGTI
jgi:hypothetical protein